MESIYQDVKTTISLGLLAPNSGNMICSSRHKLDLFLWRPFIAWIKCLVGYASSSVRIESLIDWVPQIIRTPNLNWCLGGKHCVIRFCLYGLVNVILHVLLWIFISLSKHIFILLNYRAYRCNAFLSQSILIALLVQKISKISVSKALTICIKVLWWRWHSQHFGLLKILSECKSSRIRVTFKKSCGLCEWILRRCGTSINNHGFS